MKTSLRISILACDPPSLSHWSPKNSTLHGFIKEFGGELANASLRKRERQAVVYVAQGFVQAEAAKTRMAFFD